VGTFLAKTTPSDSSKFATIADGTYSGTLVPNYHNSGYSAILLNSGNPIPTVRPNPTRANGAWIASSILVHKAGRDNFTGIGQDGRAVSKGCQVIASSQYEDYERATGMMPNDGSAPQGHFTVTVDTPENHLYADPVLPPPGES
jgi:hypothetical protein